MKTTGVVRFFNSEKGYGFIRPDVGGADLFFHASQCAPGMSLMKGDAVAFDASQDRIGRPCALKVAFD